MEENNKKKLIGTILGVVLFIALIVGATYAWFNNAANVTNGNYNAEAKNFMITYTKGTEIADMVYKKTSEATPNNITSEVVVKAKKANTQTADGTLNIIFTPDENTINVDGAINWGVSLNSEGTFHTTGSVASTSTAPITVYTGPVTVEDTSYHIHFWADPTKISNDQLGQTFKGHIHATATQNETTN